MIQFLATVNGEDTFCYNKRLQSWINMNDCDIALENIAIYDKSEIIQAFMLFESTFGFIPVKITYKEICLN